MFQLRQDLIETPHEFGLVRIILQALAGRSRELPWEMYTFASALPSVARRWDEPADACPARATVKSGIAAPIREIQLLLAINVKRVYRVMRDHNHLLERRIKQPGVPRRLKGRIAVQTSDTRWCSFGFEFRCEDGAKLSVTFALDCCDREAIGWVASPTGYSGDDIRDLMLESVEKRFGDQLPVSPAQWLRDNGSTYQLRTEPIFSGDCR